jgi:hypothetical protein
VRGRVIQIQPTVPIQAQEIRANMRRVARRQLWLWSSAVFITLLLTLGIASFAFPGLLTQAENSSFLLNQAVRGLVGLVLVFNVYTIYQQLQINRIQRQVGDQVEAICLPNGNTDRRDLQDCGS